MEPRGNDESQRCGMPTRSRHGDGGRSSAGMSLAQSGRFRVRLWRQWSGRPGAQHPARSHRRPGFFREASSGVQVAVRREAPGRRRGDRRERSRGLDQGTRSRVHSRGEPNGQRVKWRLAHGGGDLFDLDDRGNDLFQRLQVTFESGPVVEVGLPGLGKNVET